jgi:hypothetical protein
MSRVIFTALAQDSAVATTYYGAGHQADLADEAYVARLVAEGKAALMGAAIRAAHVGPIADTTAAISWTVDQPCTDMKVDYGPTAAYGSSQAATPASGSGAIVASLTGLVTATLYHYRISVTCGGFTTLSADGTFTTA